MSRHRKWFEDVKIEKTGKRGGGVRVLRLREAHLPELLDSLRTTESGDAIPLGIRIGFRRLVENVFEERSSARRAAFIQAVKRNLKEDERKSPIADLCHDVVFHLVLGCENSHLTSEWFDRSRHLAKQLDSLSKSASCIDLHEYRAELMQFTLSRYESEAKERARSWAGPSWDPSRRSFVTEMVHFSSYASSPAELSTHFVVSQLWALLSFQHIKTLFIRGVYCSSMIVREILMQRPKDSSATDIKVIDDGDLRVGRYQASSTGLGSSMLLYVDDRALHNDWIIFQGAASAVESGSNPLVRELLARSSINVFLTDERKLYGFDVRGGCWPMKPHPLPAQDEPQTWVEHSVHGTYGELRADEEEDIPSVPLGQLR